MCTCIYEYMYIYVLVYLYTCIHVYMYICIYVYVYDFFGDHFSTYRTINPNSEFHSDLRPEPHVLGLYHLKNNLVLKFLPVRIPC